MNRQEIANRVDQCIINVLEIEQGDISLESYLDRDLLLDSLDFVELMLTLEEEFNIYISNSESAWCHQVCDLYRLIEKKLGV